MSKPAKPQKKSAKKKYRVRNWKEYNEALVNRGRILFWITEEAIRQWEEAKAKKKKPGRPKQFSNTAVETALTLQQVFHLSLRQTEGFVQSVLDKVAAPCKSPDYSTLSLRAKTLSISIRVRKITHENVHVVVDSTGVKIYGEGEWKVRQHGWSKHRTWRKLHLGIDERTHDIVMGEVTMNDVADCEMLKPLFGQLSSDEKIDQVSADGAYDKRCCYAALARRHIAQVTIPPRKGARIWQHGNSKLERLKRDENLRTVRRIGRKKWKNTHNYHRRSLAETAMFRLKTIFSDKVQARSFDNQRIQLLIRCKALNMINALGMPNSYVVA